MEMLTDDVSQIQEVSKHMSFSVEVCVRGGLGEREKEIITCFFIGEVLSEDSEGTNGSQT